MTDLVLSIVLFVIIGLASGYIIRARKQGVTCIGCPDKGACSSKAAEGCGKNCGCWEENRE